MNEICWIGLNPLVSGRPLTITNWWWLAALELMNVSSIPLRALPLSVITRPRTVV